jgi:hypothetical protein
MKALLPTAALSINIAFGYTMNITLNGQTFTATLADTPAADALQQLPLTLNLRDYNRNEKVGPLPQTLPANDEAVGYIEAGDILLWQGDSLVIFYESFATPYRYTRLGKIDNVANLKSAVGAGECVSQT